ncbi:type II toxin-antitoxin system MqsA family antitoxin [Candidatus Parabeggiatoa sp. HSG14]|uniref:type II toxin-antitoxin system MqsA family antitoxin n=1 Tax=Candidatus Parabeggiatoa sp. HSG14 TaxID=3055593 RepID=UPI0025A8163C|nr:type II toxin-antitoxin system MqsA family antitoxin [Thiotrichales bacterium HSG14]
MNPERTICPMCESADLIPKKITEHYCYKGHDFSLENIEYCECPACHSEIITPEQSTRNEPRIRDEHRKIDKLLTRAEITQLRKRLKITQNQAAQIFGERVNTFSKYESGEATQSQAMDKLMKLALNVPDCFEELRKMANVQISV